MVVENGTRDPLVGQNGQLLFPEEYEWLLGAGGNPHPPVAPPSAWYGSWGGGMPQWHMPAWGYLPTHHQPETPVAGSLPARGTRFGPPVGPAHHLLVTGCLKEAGGTTTGATGPPLGGN